LHQALPRVRVQAWLGALVGRGHLDLAAAPATRARIVTSARAVVADGFDGVHLDLEPVADGDAGYLTLLAQVHAVTPLLSVAAPQVQPLGWLPWPVPHPHWWSAAYLHQVATRVNQVAIMAYDTGMPTGALYAGYLHRETELALRAVPPDVALLIGVPAYRSSALGHFNSAETVSAAIRGVRLAISPAPPGRPLGVALYVDFTATAQDWAQYQAGWNRPAAR
jgi:spore germination protein YaaH